MRSVLAFGDSLTWGSSPGISERHSFEDRWPNELASKLNDCDVISEGLRGRTTCFSQPTSPAEMSGSVMLPSLLHSHAPIDVVAIMLGSNDLYLGIPATRAAKGLARLVEQVQHHPSRLDQPVAPKIVLMAPPHMVESAMGDVSDAMIAQTRLYSTLVEGLARDTECSFFDTAAVSVASEKDGIHLDAANTCAIGEALAPIIRDLL